MFYINTIVETRNYGNRLQNRAVSELFLSYGPVSTVWRTTAYDREARQRYRRYKRSLREIGQYGARSFYEKRKRFKRFIAVDDPYITEKQFLEKLGSAPSTSVMVVGSDQVWNYNWLNRADCRWRLGLDVPQECLLSYAASIGLDDINDEWRPVFKEGWSRIPHISVREDRAAELVNEIAGREAAVVLDPTLMLTRDQWRGVFTGFVPEGDRYVLTYFLGKPSDEQERIISSSAKGLDACIRRINDVRDRGAYVAGPAEFVELFSKAQYVFTDSYHACCFSILYNRPFKVFNRSGFDGKANMNSRMRTLFRLFELEDLMNDDEALPIYDWAKINSLLERHRKESREWLENALGVKTVS